MSPADEDELRRQNPKGRLWERCAKLGVDAPRIAHREIDGRHQIELTLTLAEWELASGSWWADSRKVAEQLASRSLLEELEEVAREEGPSTRTNTDDELDDVFEVSEADARELLHANAKGRLFEWTQQQKPQVARPKFEARRMKGHVYVRARLARLELESPWFRAPRRRVAEHAAAQALLSLVAGDIRT